ncbi:MAG: DUF2628 domain-containing protein [Alphaproteobacteria bacterium]|nr:DUF2628 domain-containing protein [Alphaproteobacteria bacterium]
MKLYSGLIKLDKFGKIEDLAVIDESFSFSALIFNPLWFLFHRMWREFFAIIAIFLVFDIFLSKLFDDALWLKLTFFTMIALNSRSWLVDHLIQRKKFKLATMIFAKSSVDAKINLIKHLVENNDNKFASIFSESILNPFISNPSQSKTQIRA